MTRTSCIVSSGMAVAALLLTALPSCAQPAPPGALAESQPAAETTFPPPTTQVFRTWAHHGILTTRVAPAADGNSITLESVMETLSLDKLVLESDLIITGRVVDIFPARVDDSQPRLQPYIYTDIIISPDRFLLGEPHPYLIGASLSGGRAGSFTMIDRVRPFSISASWYASS